MSYLRLKCTIFDFGWGSAPAQTPLGELTVLAQTTKLDLSLRGSYF